jgi:hypothetical protein
VLEVVSCFLKLFQEIHLQNSIPHNQIHHTPVKYLIVRIEPSILFLSLAQRKLNKIFPLSGSERMIHQFLHNFQQTPSIIEVVSDTLSDMNFILFVKFRGNFNDKENNVNNVICGVRDGYLHDFADEG